MISLMALIVLVSGAISYRHNWRKDFTENKRHSLSEQTTNVLRDLDVDVKATAFVRQGGSDHEVLKTLFELYEYESKRIEVEIIDPDLNPGRAGEYEIGRYRPPVVFFETKSGRETITIIDEEQATNALIKLSRGAKKAVYFLTGHGERALESDADADMSAVKKLLEDKHYEPRELLLLRAEAVPEDCAILVVGGPKKDLVESELDAMKGYIDRGGRMLFLIDPETAPSLGPFLEPYGITLGDDIVIDRLSRLFGGDYLMPIPTEYSAHPITSAFNIAPFFPVVRSVSAEEVPGARTSWLLRTGERSWAETNIEALKRGEADLDPDDTPGPISLAAVSEIDAPEPTPDQAAEQAPDRIGDDSKAAIVVFGDSDFVSNARINLSGNADLFMNVIYWLGREETLIAIPPRKKDSAPLVLSATEARMLFALPVFVLPGAVLAVGVFIFIRRSRHP
jgi:ABC-type uncharacterized transport system involved in gliding motility auxiliary subunit